MIRINKAALVLFLMSIILMAGCKTDVQSLIFPTTEKTQIEKISEVNPIVVRTQNPQNTNEIGSNDNTLQMVNIDGNIYFACIRSIGMYDLHNHLYNEIMVFSGSETIFDANKQEMSLYFLKTTNLSSTDIYEYRLNDNNVFQITDVGTLLQRSGLNVIPETNNILYAANLGETAFSGQQFKLYLENMVTGESEVIFEKDYPFKMDLSPNHNYLAIYFFDSEENGINIYDFYQHKYFQVLANENIILRSIAWSKDSKYLAVPIENENQKMVIILNSDTWEIEKIINFQYEPSIIAFSNEGNKLLIETRDRTKIYNGDGDIKLILYNFNRDNQTEIQAGGIIGGTRNYGAIWSPNDDYIAYFTGQINGGTQLIVYDTNSQKIVQRNEILNCSYINYAIWEEK